MRNSTYYTYGWSYGCYDELSLSTGTYTLVSRVSYTPTAMWNTCSPARDDALVPIITVMQPGL